MRMLNRQCGLFVASPHPAGFSDEIERRVPEDTLRLNLGRSRTLGADGRSSPSGSLAAIMNGGTLRIIGNHEPRTARLIMGDLDQAATIGDANRFRRLPLDVELPQSGLDLGERGQRQTRRR